MNKKILSLSIVLLLSKILFGQDHGNLSKSDFVKVDFSILAQKKAKLKERDAVLVSSYKRLLKDADKSLRFQPVSVMDKTNIPPSGNKHDYMSIAVYWWPNPAKPNGVPYIRKDGEVNPEVANYSDKENLPKMCEHVYNLSLAYYFSGNEQYAKHVAKLLKVWFLDSTTKMNPNLNYGQAIKGVNDGRAEGLIETRHFIYLLDAITLIKPSKSWSDKNHQDIKDWFATFFNWMETSKIGNDEMKSKNNHGVWFDAQSLAIAQFLDSTTLANKILARSINRLDKELDDKGFFPLEMERTTSLHYTVFILNAFELIAQMSEKTNTNLWTLETTSGKSFKKAFEAALPYISKEKEWIGKQIKSFQYSDAFPLLLRANTKFGCYKCLDYIKNLTPEHYDEMVLNLL